METVLILFCLLVSLLLIAVVLIQPGKADMVSGMGGLGGQVTNLFGVRQSRNILQSITIGLAVTLALMAILINVFFMGEVVAERTPVTEGAPIPTQSIPADMPAPPLPGQAQPSQGEPTQDGK